MAGTSRIVELDRTIADGDQALVRAVVDRIKIALDCASGMSIDASGTYADGLRDASRITGRIIPVRSRPQPSSAAAAVDNVRALLPFLDDKVAGRILAALEGADLAASAQRVRESARGVESPNSWADLFPDGRVIFYEGDNPDEFVTTIRREFGFDPSADTQWGAQIPVEGPESPYISYAFLCPPGLMDVIYGDDRFPLGS
jgi:hypothetical protein